MKAAAAARVRLFGRPSAGATSSWKKNEFTRYERHAHTHTYTHPFNGPLSGTTQLSQYQKGKTNLDFTEARDSEWQRHQLGRMQVCTSLQTDNHTSTPPLSFLQAGCPSCRPSNSVKALKATSVTRNQSLLSRVGLACITSCACVVADRYSTFRPRVRILGRIARIAIA